MTHFVGSTLVIADEEEGTVRAAMDTRFGSASNIVTLLGEDDDV